MDIIQYFLNYVTTLYQNYCWLLMFVCKYIPLKQWAFDDSHSPKYQKFNPRSGKSDFDSICFTVE